MRLDIEYGEDHVCVGLVIDGSAEQDSPAFGNTTLISVPLQLTPAEEEVLRAMRVLESDKFEEALQSLLQQAFRAGREAGRTISA
jgi:hypothetical protein